MQWSIIRSWAKDKGYTTSRAKNDNPDEPNDYIYSWSKNNDPSVCGTTTSVSKLATAIFNNLTNNAYVRYQNEYKLKKDNTDIDHKGLSGSW